MTCRKPLVCFIQLLSRLPFSPALTTTPGVLSGLLLLIVFGIELLSTEVVVQLDLGQVEASVLSEEGFRLRSCTLPEHALPMGGSD
jgi:hypothetical protein